MAVNILPLPNSVMTDFEILAASDPRACLLVNALGIVQSVNPAVKHSLPGIEPGTDIMSVCASPDVVAEFLTQCARTRGPVPGSIVLTGADGEPNDWSCHGGLVGDAADGSALIILRLQLSELGKSAFAKLNQKINALNSEIEWRIRADQATAHLAAIVASSTDAIYSKDMDDKITSWNKGAERMFGYSAEEIVGTSSQSLIPQDGRAEEAMIMRRVTAGETLEPIETVRQCRNGNLLDVSITPSPIRNRAGVIIGISKIVRDISVRKRIERSLSAANSTFEQLVNNSPFGIYCIDADFRIALVSAGAQKVFENVRPLIGHDFSDALRILWPEPIASEFIALFRHTLETGEAYHGPNTVEHRNDTAEQEAYDWKIERMILSDGRPGVVCHFYDLSEHQKFEAALRESEQRFRGTFENASVGIAHVGLNGQWLEFNDRLCTLLGYTRDELLQRTLDSVRHPNDHALDAEQVDGLLSGDVTSIQCEERYIRKDGSIIWLGVSVGLQRDEKDGPAYLIHVARDVSDRKAAQEHQEFLMHELSHRSKNQLAVISAMARQTARNAKSLDDFRGLFEQRLHGLAVSIDMLVKQGWSGVPLRNLIDKQLEAFKGDDDRLKCDGPEVTLNSAAAESIGLALHELSTNCLKYGAWSVPTGTVSIIWEFRSADTAKQLYLQWVERGGPPVSKPTHRGFGQTVIEHLVAQKLDAKVELSYPTDGVEWTLLLPFGE